MDKDGRSTSSAGAICARPGCTQPLVTGKQYCSRACANKDRARVKAALPAVPAAQIFPPGVVALVEAAVGNDATPSILKAMESVMLQEAPAMPYPRREAFLTKGTDDSKPGEPPSKYDEESLEWDTVDSMLVDGQVVFALALKTAAVRAAMRNTDTWRVVARDEKQAAIAEAILGQVLAKYMNDMLSCLPYGVALMEVAWDRMTAEALGLAGKDGRSRPRRDDHFDVPQLGACHPNTIKQMEFTQGRFDGFTQNAVGGKINETRVQVQDSFVITHDKRFRNLWGRSIMRPAYPFWYFNQIAWAALMNYLKRQGTPVAVCRAPQRGWVTRADGTKVKASDLALVIAGDIAHSNAAYLPSDRDEQGNYLWELAYLTSQERVAQWAQVLEMISSMILRSMVIGERAATQGTQVGSYAAATVHAVITALHNETILVELVDHINRYLLPKIMLANFGSQVHAQLVTEGLDPSEKGIIGRFISQAINQASDLPHLVDWRGSLQKIGVPLVSEEEYKARKQEAEQKQKEMFEQKRQIAQKSEPGGQTKEEAPDRRKKVQPEGTPRVGDKLEGMEADVALALEAMARGEKPPMMVTEQQLQRLETLNG